MLGGTLSGDTFTTVNRYVWEEDDYYSPLIHADFADQTRYFLYDGLGSTRQLLDASQEAFGNVLSDGGPTPNPYQYVGSLGYYQIYPPEAGGPTLMHLGARYYMPALGRFTQRDPVGIGRGLYAYGRSDPNNGVDPTGNRSVEIVDREDVQPGFTGTYTWLTEDWAETWCEDHPPGTRACLVV